MDGIVALSYDQLDKLFRKNTLLDVLGNEGQQICVVGDTSTGKSTVINFLLGFPINFEASGIGTRRPCVLTQVQRVGQKTVQFEARFCKGGENIEVGPTEDVNEIAAVVAKANNHRNFHFFDVLPKDCDLDRAYEEAFDHEPVYVMMTHEDFKYGVRLIDLPGLTRRNAAPLHIAETYIQPGNVAILVMGKDNASNGGFPDLAARMTQCSQVLVIQNFAYSLFKGGSNVEDNWDCIEKNFRKNKSSHADNLMVNCVDFGLPKLAKYVEDGRWTASAEGRVGDQEDWTQLAKSGGLEVQESMYRHASGWARKLLDDFPDKFGNDANFTSGIMPVLEQVINFQLHDVDGQLHQLKDAVRKRMQGFEEDLEDMLSRRERLQDPPEWQDLLSKLSTVVSEYLDTTIAIPDEKEDREIAASLMTIDEEIKATLDADRPEDEDNDELQNEDDPDPDPCHWFSQDLDLKILGLVSSECEREGKLACLRSWYRLLDEFTAMLAFAPMPWVSKHQKTQAYQRIGIGQAADINKLDTMVELVSRANLFPSKTPIRSQLLTYKKRFRYICRRDLKNAVKMFAEDLTNEVKNFLELIGDPTEERRQWLLERLERGLLENAEVMIRKTIDGEFLATLKGERIADRVSGKKLKKDGKGLRVRIRENSNPGPCHWLVPFKAHYVNGQIPWLDLGINLSERPAAEEDHPAGGSFEVHFPAGRPQLEEEDLLNEVLPDERSQDKETGAMNAVNAVNMRIYELATLDYTMPDAEHLDDRNCSIDLEVMKMLKAMQAEIAAFWASAWKRMIQQIKDPSMISDEVELKVIETYKSLNMINTIGTEHVQELTSSYKRALDRVNGVISGYDFPKESLKDTRKEIAEGKIALQKRADSSRRDDSGRRGAGGRRQDSGVKGRIRERPINYSDPWPGLDDHTYNSLLEGDHPFDENSFPNTMDVPCAGETSWMRLCEEFIFVILQLAMKRVTHQELQMARASSGKALVEGPFGIVTKLVLHRLRGIFQNGGEIFKARMMLLYERDLEVGMKKIASYNLPNLPKAGGTLHEGANFVHDFLLGRAQRVVEETLASLQFKFNELLPFDFSILNGRLPLLDIALRHPDFAIDYNSSLGALEARQKDEEETKHKLVELWDQPLKEQWESMKGAMVVLPTPGKDPKRDVPGLVLDQATNVAAIACLNDTKAKRRIEDFSQLRDTAPPDPEGRMAGGAFHATLLRIHKAMHVNAIDYCRPKLKEMMACIYQVDHVRSMLQRTKYLGRSMWKELEEKADVSCKDMQNRIDIMRKALEIADAPAPPPPQAPLKELATGRGKGQDHALEIEGIPYSEERNCRKCAVA